MTTRHEPPSAQTRRPELDPNACPEVLHDASCPTAQSTPRAQGAAA
jgi:hypothetical protein